MRTLSSSLLLLALASSSLACNAILGIEDVDFDESAAQGGQGGAGQGGQGGAAAGESGSSGQSGAGQAGATAGVAGESGSAGAAGDGGAAGDAGAGGESGAAGTSAGGGQGGAGPAGSGGMSGGSGQAGSCPSAGAAGSPVQQVLVRGARQPGPAFLGAAAASALPAIEPCPAGYVLAGLAGRIDASTTSTYRSRVTNLRGECRAIHLSKAAAPVVTTGGVDYRTRPIGSWSQASTAWSNRCPDGEVVVGAHVDTTGDGDPGDMVVSCAPLSLSCTGPYVASLGAAHDVGNDLLTTTASQPGGACPAGMVAVGLRSTGDVVIEGAALDCAPLTVVASPDECTTAADCAAPTSVCQVGSCVDGLCQATDLPAGALPREVNHKDCQQISCQGDGIGLVLGDENFGGTTCLGCNSGAGITKTASCSLLSGNAETGACQDGICSVAGNNVANRNKVEKTGTTPTQLGLTFDGLNVPYNILKGYYQTHPPQPAFSVLEMCGPGEVATGMAGKRSAVGSPTGNSIVEFSLRCSRLDLVAGQTATTTTNGYVSPSRYSQGTSPGWQFDCPAGTAVTRVGMILHDFPSGKDLPDNIGFRCTPISLNASNQLSFASTFTEPGSGGTGGATYVTYADCPPGQMVVGMQGYGTTTLGDLGPICGRPTVVTDPGECQTDADCAVTGQCRRVACVRGLCDDRQVPSGWPARVLTDDPAITTDDCKVRRCDLNGEVAIETDEPAQPEANGCFTCDGGKQVVARDEGTGCKIDGGTVCTTAGACIGAL